ncbi:MAG: hypothetical protein Kow0029_03370 [Candidatus Rifleibacteriota bacterium]
MKKSLNYLICLTALFLLASSLAHAQINVLSEKVKTAHIRKLLKFTGDTKPFIETYAAADVSGPVAKILVEDGQRVEKDQPLAVIDEARFEIALRMAQAELERAKQQLKEIQKDFERNKTLFDKGAITQKTYDMAETAMIQASTAMKLAQANYDKAKLDLDRCVIKAPIKGFFVDRAIELGQAMARGQNMGKVIFLDTVFVEARISEKDINSIKIGQKCVIEDKFPGIISFINLYADKSRAFKVKIKMDNPDVYFKANMFVKGSVIIEEYENAPVFPSRAIRNNRGKLFVFVLEGDKAVKKEINIIAQEGELTYANPITEGMEVVTIGQDNLDDGSLVIKRNSQSRE